MPAPASADDGCDSRALCGAWPRGRGVVLCALGVAAAASLGLAVWQAARLTRPQPAEPPPVDEWFAPELATGGADVLVLKQLAIDGARRLLERFPDRAEAMDVVARLHARFGLRDHAARCWQRCLELDPQFADAYRCLGILCREKGEYGKAAAASGDSPAVLYDLADALVKLDALDEAMSVVQKSLAADPHFVPGLFQLGNIHLRRKEYQQARGALERAVEAGPDFSAAYSPLATACARLGDVEAAQRYTEKRKSLRAQEPDVYREAGKSLEASADVRQNVADVLTAGARAYLFFGQPAMAEEDLLVACRAAPDHPECRRTLAWLYQQQGRDDDALKTLEEALRASPDHLGVCVDLAALCDRAGRWEEAESLLRKGIALAPGRPESSAALADFYLRHGRNLPEAKALAAKAAGLGRTAPMYLLLAAACRANGDLEGAAEAARHAMALDPTSAECRRALESLESSGGK